MRYPAGLCSTSPLGSSSSCTPVISLIGLELTAHLSARLVPASSPAAAGSAKDTLLPSPSPPALPISSLGPGVDPMSFSRAVWKTQPGVLRIPAYTPPSCLCPGSGPVSLSVPLIPRRSSRLPDLCTDLSLLAPPAPCSPGISAWDRDLGSSLHSRLGQSSCHTYW